MPVTISGGIAEYRNETVEALIGLADKRLNMAKQSGKNRFVGAPGPLNRNDV